MQNITIYNFTIKYVNYKIVYWNVVHLLIIVSKNLISIHVESGISFPLQLPFCLMGSPQRIYSFKFLSVPSANSKAEYWSIMTEKS
jgi:hypothetical protein